MRLITKNNNCEVNFMFSVISLIVLCCCDILLYQSYLFFTISSKLEINSEDGCLGNKTSTKSIVTLFQLEEREQKHFL